LWIDTQRLAAVFLMDAAYQAVDLAVSVVPLDDDRQSSADGDELSVGGSDAGE
jgi:hypothetical protein